MLVCLSLIPATITPLEEPGNGTENRAMPTLLRVFISLFVLFKFVKVQESRLGMNDTHQGLILIIPKCCLGNLFKV